MGSRSSAAAANASARYRRTPTARRARGGGPSPIGLVLALVPRPIYSFYEHAPRLWGLSPIRDQNLGGIVMNGEQTLVFLLAIGWFVVRLLDEEHARKPVSLSDS